MKISPIFHPAVPVFVAPVNAATQRWGAYAIPWMWREPSGKLVVCVNGTPDNCDISYGFSTKDLYFVSEDEGKSFSPADPEGIRVPSFTGVEPPYLPLSDGRVVAVHLCEGNLPIGDVPVQKRFVGVNREVLLHTFHHSDIPKECRAIEMEIYEKDGTRHCRPIEVNFPSLEISTFVASRSTNGKETICDEFVPVSEVRYQPYQSIHSLLELADGSIAGMMCGQSPKVSDREWEMVYMVVSEDGGKTFSPRAAITTEEDPPRFGYSYENSMTVAPNGDLLVVMRTEHCVPLEIEPSTDAMFSRSTDGGYTWSRPVPIADSCVTPHLITLKNGVIVFLYGRPGIHMKFSTDSGHTWSEPVTLIGKTLEEHRARGDSYMDCKFWDMETYANTFVSVVDEETFAVCYTDVKYKTGDGLDHKATLVRRITVRAEE